MLDVQTKRKLAWRCRRGMLELDLVLEAFLEKKVHALSAEELKTFESLLNHPDPQLYAWFMGQEEPSQTEFKHIVCLIRNNH